MDTSPTGRFYDDLAADHDRMFADWDAGIRAQGRRWAG
jgi:hypothetical protein